MKKLMITSITVILLLLFSITCFAESQYLKRDYAVGWQFSRPANGFSLKIPIQTDYYIQPIFSIAMSKGNSTTTGHYALGVRGIYNLQPHQDFLPYAGVAIGYSENFQKAADSSYANGNVAYEAFFGVEYQKYLVRPSFELGIGGQNKYDGSFEAGIICNLSVMYYF